MEPMQQRVRRLPIRDILLLAALAGAALVLARWSYQPVHTAVFAIDTPPVLLRLAGFHEVEAFPDGSGSYRWMKGEGTITLPNPGGIAVVQLVMAGGAGRTVAVHGASGPSRLSFLIGPELRRYTLLLPTPPSERLHLTLAAPTIAARNRTLGVVVGDIRISGGGAAPGSLLLLLWLASFSSYLLLRQAGLAAWPAAGLVSGAQVLLLLWLAAGGWRYALAGSLLLLISGASLGAVLLEQWLLRRSQPLPAAACALQRLPCTLSDCWPLAAALALAVIVRLPWLAAPDPVGDMELAARRMWLLDMHGLAGAYLGNGDYMPLRLALLQGLSQLVVPLGGDFHAPLPAITKLLIKLPGLLADLAAAALIYDRARRWLPPRRAAAVAALYACAPPIWMNSAWWGQVDSLLMLPLIAMVVLLEQSAGRWSWLCWTAALLIKPQAIVFAPLLFIATLRLHGSRGVAQGGALAILVFALSCVPLVAAGQGPGLMQAYLGSVGRFPMLTAGAYNLWYLVTLGGGAHDMGQGIGGVSFRHIGLLLTASSVLLVGAALLRRSDGPIRAEGAAVLALAFFCLPTQIHERYLFLSLAFLALLIPGNEKLVLPFLLLVGSATLNILGDLDGFIPLATAMLEDSPVPFVLAAINLGLLAFFIGHLLISSQQPAFHPIPSESEQQQVLSEIAQ